MTIIYYRLTILHAGYGRVLISSDTVVNGKRRVSTIILFLQGIEQFRLPVLGKEPCPMYPVKAFSPSTLKYATISCIVRVVRKRVHYIIHGTVVPVTDMA